MSRLRMLARVGRTTTYTKEEIMVKLAQHGTPEEVKQAVDEAFAIPKETFDLCLSGCHPQTENLALDQDAARQRRLLPPPSTP